MKKNILAAVAALTLLAGCSVHKPGGFERVAEDKSDNTVQYRYDPQTVNQDAMQLDLSQYCEQHGFDKVEGLPAQDSHYPGLKKKWFQCNYAVKS
ncbi:MULTISPECIES: hypothetical protein [Pantoea]|uniref:Lipoprotein n=1 Tax=Candidatus Pantoea multigeneris TaxID=2608357 RepID=A0ABX0RBQ0_9GAMM|nr:MULTISPECIES: hypothetical protein [Pantoea]NIF20894.1 hypothetical protein [Pantoea multigeneris]